MKADDKALRKSLDSTLQELVEDMKRWDAEQAERDERWRRLLSGEEREA